VGYYTSYNLEIEPKGSKKLNGVIAWLEKNSETTTGYNLMSFYKNDGSADSCKWYGHEEDMKELSTRFPDFLFTLSGEGEESGDIWTKYFLGGKMQVAKAVIVVPEFDPKLLK